MDDYVPLSSKAFIIFIIQQSFTITFLRYSWRLGETSLHNLSSCTRISECPPCDLLSYAAGL
jgi:hypothetical protein